MAEINGVEHHEERSQSETGDSKAGSDGSDLSGQADDLTDLRLAPAFPPMRAGNHSLILTHRE